MLRSIMRKPQAIAGLAMMGAVIFCMIFAPVIAPNDPDKVDITRKLLPPGGQFPLGTDDLGHCLFSRLLYGARTSMSIALPTVGILAVISTLSGVLCGYAGGAADRIFTVISNIFMAFPPFLIAMTLVGQFESQAIGIMFSIVVAMWVWNARVARTYGVSERNKDYIVTCRMSGCSEREIIFSHVLPNIIPHLIVLYSTGLSSIIIMISSYAFLGLGLEAGTAEWGSMLVGAGKLIYTHPEMIIWPGLCILFAAAGFNLFGEALRDILNHED